MLYDRKIVAHRSHIDIEYISTRTLTKILNSINLGKVPELLRNKEMDDAAFVKSLFTAR